MLRRQMQRGATAQNLSILDLLFVIFLFAVPMGAWQWMSHFGARQAKLAEELSKYGSVTMETRVPTWLEGRLPTWMVERNARIVAVQAENPTDEIVEKILTLWDIERLRLGGDKYELSQLDRLPRYQHLHDLRIAGRLIDDQLLVQISQTPNIRSLSLIRTNLDAEGLELLGTMPAMRRLAVTDTPLREGDLNSAPWAQRIWELHLPRPAPGETDNIEIVGWPELRQLYVMSMTMRKNRESIRLSLRDLPELNSLFLEPLQAFDLRLENTPNLPEIKTVAQSWKHRLSKSEKMAGSTWVRKLHIDGAPKLRELNVYGAELTDYSIRGTEALKTFGIGIFQSSPLGRTEYDTDIPEEIRQAWIDGLGNSEGPATVDFDAIPLDGVDLSPLNNNPGIEHLMLRYSNTTAEQLQSLDGMVNLNELNIDGNEIDQRGFDAIINGLPKLARLSVSADKIHSLEIRDHANLTDLASRSTGLEPGRSYPPQLEEYYRRWNAQRVVLENLPKLSGRFVFHYPVHESSISNVPELTGLVFHAPLVPTRLDGFRKLQTFAVGGDKITNEHLQWLAQCPELTRLALLQTSVDDAGLAGLSNCSLVQLSLQGTKVSDASITPLNVDSLRRVNLVDTNVGGAAVSHILKAPKLETLMVSASTAQESDIVTSSPNTLRTLEIPGVQLTANGLKKLFSQSPRLTRLHLSDTKLDAEMAGEFVALKDSLTQLVLQRCELSDAAITQLASSLPRLQFDVSGSTVSPSLEAQLLGANRVIEEGLAFSAFYEMGQPDAPDLEEPLINEAAFVEWQRMQAQQRVFLNPANAASINAVTSDGQTPDSETEDSTE